MSASQDSSDRYIFPQVTFLWIHRLWIQGLSLISLSLPGLVAGSSCGSGPSAHPGGGVQGDPGHHVLQEEAPFAEEMDGAPFAG